MEKMNTNKGRGMNYEVRNAVGQQNLLLKTYNISLRIFYSIRLDKQTTTKYYSHV